MSEEVTEIRRFAIKYNPPSLIVVYKKQNEKVYMKKIRFQENVLLTISASDLTTKLIRRHNDVFNPEKVCSEQIEDLIALLIQGYNEHNNMSIDDIETENNINDYNNKRQTAHDVISKKYGDLNKLSDEEVAKAKREMDSDFEMNRVKPGDKDFVYDKQVEFEAPDEANEWDDEEDDF